MDIRYYVNRIVKQWDSFLQKCIVKFMLILTCYICVKRSIHYMFWSFSVFMLVLLGLCIVDCGRWIYIYWHFNKVLLYCVKCIIKIIGTELSTKVYLTIIAYNIHVHYLFFFFSTIFNEGVNLTYRQSSIRPTKLVSFLFWEQTR